MRVSRRKAVDDVWFRNEVVDVLIYIDDEMTPNGVVCEAPRR